MSIKAALSSDGLEELYSPPSLKEMCLYKCLTNKEILTKEVKVDGEGSNGCEKLDWEKFRLKEPVQQDLLEALLDAGEKYLFMLTPNYQPILAAIRMSQPEHLVKVHVNNTATLEGCQLEFLISGGNVKSLDINGCRSLGWKSLDAINKFGNKLEYLRIGNSSQILPSPFSWRYKQSSILRTPNLKTFIIGRIDGDFTEAGDDENYWRFLLQDFIKNLEDLQISSSWTFGTLKFLIPARNKLSALTLRHCEVMGEDWVEDANVWASLLKLDKLRFLDVVGSAISRNVMQRLLTAIPNLKHLAVDFGLVKHMHVETLVRGQGSVAKRLEFLGIMANVDEDELRTAKLLANDVAYFGTVEGELRILEYYSSRPNNVDFDHTLKWRFDSLNMIPLCKTVAVTNLLLSTLKNNGVTEDPELFFQHFKKLLTPDVAAKLGEAHLDQCIGVISACVTRRSKEHYEAKAVIILISDVMDVVLNLEGTLRFDNYATILPMVMRMLVEATVTTRFRWDYIGRDWEAIRNLLGNVAQVLENAGDRFPGEVDALWGISSVLVVAKEFKDVKLSAKLDRAHLMKIFASIIPSLGKLCLNSCAQRATLHWTIMEWLTEIIDGRLELAHRDSFVLALLEFLKCILQDTKLNSSESWDLARRLEALLFTIHSKWGSGKSNSVSVKGGTYYDQLESIARLLKFLESYPGFHYEAGADAKKIIVKLE